MTTSTSSNEGRTRFASIIDAVAPAKARLRSISISGSTGAGRHHGRVKSMSPLTPRDENFDLHEEQPSILRRRTSILGRRASYKSKRKLDPLRERNAMQGYASRAEVLSKSSPDLSSITPENDSYFRSFADIVADGSQETERQAARDAALARLTNSTPPESLPLPQQARRALQRNLALWLPNDLDSRLDSFALWTILRDGRILLALFKSLDSGELAATLPATPDTVEQLLAFGRQLFVRFELPWFTAEDLLRHDAARLEKVLRLVVALDAAVAAERQGRPPLERRDSPKRPRAATTTARSTPSVTFASHSYSVDRQDAARPSIYGDRRKAESAVELTSVDEEADVASTAPHVPILSRSKTVRPSAHDMRRHNSDSPNARRRHRLSHELVMTNRVVLTGASSSSTTSILRNSFDAPSSRASFDRSFSSHEDDSLSSRKSSQFLSSTAGDIRNIRPQLHKRWDSEVYIERSSNEFRTPRSPVSNDGEAKRSSRSVRVKLVLREKGRPTLTYQLGECIGKGQFGSVYRALNLNSGRIVAVKRIALEDKSEKEIAQLSHEVDLLKRLEHAAVVKYEGLVRTQHYLNIVLEFVENGSLLTTLKHFGELPESLVASYVVKILEGLVYLHSQNVVHCDLKAANILTTKNGNIKLSDFGVSLNLNAVQNIKQDVPSVNGTPYWMAPEVIELQGPSFASDIWSLGCTIIELCTGKPPYSELVAMSAMFRIVTDARPPLPPLCSRELRAFLGACFAKDPLDRPTARDLLGHTWLRENWDAVKDLRPQDSLPFLRRISHETSRPSASGTSFLPSQSTSSLVNELASGSSSPTLEQGPVHSSGVAFRASHSEANLVAVLRQSVDERVDRAPSRAHCFVNTTFSKAVDCKLCGETTKRHAVLCKDCGLVAHVRCSEFAPLPCDLRSQLLGYGHGPAKAVVRPALHASASSSSNSFNFGLHILPSAFHRARKTKAVPASPSTLSDPRGTNEARPTVSSTHRGDSCSSFGPSASGASADMHDPFSALQSPDANSSEPAQAHDRRMRTEPLSKSTLSKLQRRASHSRAHSASTKDQCLIQ